MLEVMKDTVSKGNKFNDTNNQLVSSSNRTYSTLSGIEIHKKFLNFLEECDKQDRLTGRRNSKGENIRAKIQKAINS